MFESHIFFTLELDLHSQLNSIYLQLNLLSWSDIKTSDSFSTVLRHIQHDSPGFCTNSLGSVARLA